MDILSDVKALLGIDDACQDNLLHTLIKKCIVDIQAFCNDTFLDESGELYLPITLKGVLIDYVIISYRRMGAEGKSAESLGDYSFTFYSGVEDLPKSLKVRLYAHRKMRVY